jgi:L-malate glycosyltransferase
MRIVIALPGYANFPIGGYHVHYQYANLLSRKAHDVTVVFPRYLIASLGFVGRLKADLRTALWALDLRLRNRPLIGSFALDDAVRVRFVPNLTGNSLPSADVLIATSWHTAEAMADAPLRCGRKFYIVYDYEYWMTVEPQTRARIEQTYRQDFKIIATSSIVSETVRQHGGKPVAQIPCGIDFDAFGVDIAPADRQPLHVGFPARDEPFKGAHDAIVAASLLRDRFGDRLRVAAFGRQRLEYMPDWIEWHQYPSQQVLREFYNTQSVFMFPSHFEGWGLPGVEAMACGAALVTADNGGSRDYAINGETALVVPPMQPARLADAVETLLNDESLRLQLALSGNAFVQRYSWSDSADRLEETLLADDLPAGREAR